MNQIESHSQTASFVKNESNTKPVLFQHPTQAEMRPSRGAQFKANAKDFGIFLLFALIAWLLITLFLNFLFGG